MKKFLKPFLLALSLCVGALPAQAAYTTTATIASGQSMSTVIDLSSWIPKGSPGMAGIDIPAAWTTANLTFFKCPDATGVGCHELYDGEANEYTVVVAGTSIYILIDQSVFNVLTYFMIQSGTTGSPVDQSAARSLTITLGGGAVP